MSSGRACAGVQEDTHVVIIAFPQPPLARVRRGWGLCCPSCCVGFATIVFFFIITGPYLIVNSCHNAPAIALEDFTIREMAVFHNVTANSVPSWQVTSDTNLTLSMRNPNTVARCFTTLRRMEVTVYYQGYPISVSDIPLGFSLKPRSSRAVSAELKGERFQMTNETGVALEAVLRSVDSLTLLLKIDTRHLISDRRSFWTHQVCEVVATTPQESNSRLGSLLRGKCVDGTLFASLFLSQA